MSARTDRVNSNDSVRYANSIVVATDGLIFFTTAATCFAPREWGGKLTLHHF
jgi:hypothetical protein